MKMLLTALAALLLIPCSNLFAAGNQITTIVQAPYNNPLQLTAQDSLGNPVAATWAVSSGVGIVGPTSGLFNGTALGASTITADFQGKFSTVDLEVVDGFEIQGAATALQSNLAVYGDKVAYVNLTGQLEVRDLKTGGVTTVAGTDVGEEWAWKNLVMHENYIAWVGKDRSIYYYDINTGTTEAIGSSFGSGECIGLHNGKIVYYNSSGVQLYTIADGTTKFIGEGEWPDIHGDYVVYHMPPQSGHHLVVYSLISNQVLKSIDVEHGTNMVFQYSFQDGKVGMIDFTNKNLMFYDIYQDRLVSIANPPGVDLIWEPLSMRGNKILYTAGTNQWGLLGVYMYDLENGVHKQLSPNHWVCSGNIGSEHIVLQNSNKLFLYQK